MYHVNLDVPSDVTKFSVLRVSEFMIRNEGLCSMVAGEGWRHGASLDFCFAVLVMFFYMLWSDGFPFIFIIWHVSHEEVVSWDKTPNAYGQDPFCVSFPDA